MTKILQSLIMKVADVTRAEAEVGVCIYVRGIYIVTPANLDL